MIITHKIKIDMCRRSVPENIDAVQGDGNTRAIQITLTADSVAWEIPSGTTAAVAFLKPDGTKGLYDKLPNGDAAISMSGNTVTAIMAPQVLTCVGAVMASIVFYDRDMDTLATFPFRITAARNPAAGEQVSNDYYEFTTLEEVNEAVKAAIASLEKAKEDFMAETGKAQADFLAKAEEALSVVHGAATEDAPAIVCEATGQTVQVADASNRVLHGLTLYGKTTQNGTPTPESPVPLESVGDSGEINTTIAGKNLIPYPYRQTTSTANGITFTDNGDGSITINGTASADVSFSFNHIPVRAGQTYFYKAIPISGSLHTIYAYIETGDEDCVYDTGNGSKFTPVATKAKTSMVVTKGQTFTNLVVKPQLVIGETATEYEPYKPAQTLTAQTPNGLPGILVTDATIATYTDENGQQWVCDEVDFARGVYVKRVGQQVLTGGEYFVCYTQSNGIDTLVQMPLYGIDAAKKYDSNIVTYSTHFKGSIDGWVAMPANSVQYYSTVAAYVFSGIITEDEVRVFFTEQYNSGTPVKTLYLLATPIETALSAEELAQYAALHSNKPNTTVYNDAGAGMKLEYVADTKTYIDNKFAELAAAIVNNA